jgi:hypothetical protein
MRTDVAKQCPVCNLTFGAMAQFCHRDGTPLHALASPIGGGALCQQVRTSTHLSVERTGAVASAVTGPVVVSVTNSGRRSMMAQQLPSPLAHLSDVSLIEAVHMQAAGMEDVAPWNPFEADSFVPTSTLSRGRLLLALATLAVGFALLVWILAIAFWPSPKLTAPTEPAATAESVSVQAVPPADLTVEATEPPPSAAGRIPDPFLPSPPPPAPRTTEATTAKTAPTANTNSPASQTPRPGAARRSRRIAARGRTVEERREQAKEARKAREKAREKAAKRARKRFEKSR